MIKKAGTYLIAQDIICIEENWPVRWHLNFDCKTAHSQHLKTIYYYDKWWYSSNDTKTSLHFIVVNIHFQIVKSPKFFQHIVFNSLFYNVDFLSDVIYCIQRFRVPLCTKFRNGIDIWILCRIIYLMMILWRILQMIVQVSRKKLFNLLEHFQAKYRVFENNVLLKICHFSPNTLMLMLFRNGCRLV